MTSSIKRLSGPVSYRSQRKQHIIYAVFVVEEGAEIFQPSHLSLVGKALNLRTLPSYSLHSFLEGMRRGRTLRGGGVFTVVV
jgi:hypothetical protein